MKEKIKYKNLRKRIIKYKMNKYNFCITECPDDEDVFVGSHACHHCNKFLDDDEDENEKGGTVTCLEDYIHF
jgi:hypothetical protein